MSEAGGEGAGLYVVVNNKLKKRTGGGEGASRRYLWLTNDRTRGREVNEFLELDLGEPEGDGDENRAQPRTRNVSKQVVRRIVRGEHHAISASNARLRQQLRELAGGCCGFGDRQHLIAIRDRGTGRVRECRLIKRVRRVVNRGFMQGSSNPS